MILKISTLLLTLLFVSTLQRKVEWNSIQPKQMSRTASTEKTVENMKRESRIVGGQEAKPMMFPYQAGLNIDTPRGPNFCGGSVISKRTILTAAQCADGTTSFEVLLGTTSRIEETPGEMKIQTNTSIVHPDWDPDTLRNDIALVILNEDITFSDQISPVTLAPSSSQNDNLFGQKAIVSGWGKTSNFQPNITPELRYATVRITDSRACKMYYFDRFPPTDICVSGSTLTGACQGDSGDPLTVNGTQVGIVSFVGFGYCQRGLPFGYTRVAAYIDFITENSDYQA